MKFIPDELKVFVVYLVTEGLVSIGNQFGIDLHGKAAAAAGSLVAAVVLLADAGLTALPADKQSIAHAALVLVVTILSAYGFNDTVKRFSNAAKGKESKGAFVPSVGDVNVDSGGMLHIDGVAYRR